MVETIPLSQRRVDIVLVAFFLINLPFVSYFIDTEQLVIANPAHFTYPIWPPRPVIDAVHWWGNNFDPLLIARPVFFKVTIWLLQPGSDGFANPRHVLIFALLCLWAIRLTANWATQWRGLGHEDWRYQDIRKQTGFFYWPASFLGIHLMPTLLVFLGCLALWPTLSDRNTHLSWLDGVAALVTLAAVIIEGTADLQMRRFLSKPGSAKRAIPPGLWSASRHPNYFGEVLFWWGLYLFVPLAYANFWWVIAGPVAILLLFLGVSIPLMERHLLAGHPTYTEYQQRVSPFFPWVSR